MLAVRKLIQGFVAAVIFIAPFLCIRFCQLHHTMEALSAAPTYSGELSFLQSLPNPVCGDLQTAAGAHAGNSLIDKLNRMFSQLTEFVPAIVALAMACVVLGWISTWQHILRPFTPETPHRPPRFAIA